MNETTPSGPRFTHISSPAHLLARPLPDELMAKVPAAERKRHEELVGRVEQASRESSRLRAELADAPRRDREAASNAALAGEEELPERSEAKLRAQIEQAGQVRAALDDALRRSANRLLAAAAANAEGVAGELEQRLADGAADVRARLADLREAVGELAELYGSAAWVRWLAAEGEGTIRPFTAGNSKAMQNVLGELRTVEAALTDDLASAEERLRVARVEREEQRRLGEQWARERQAAQESKTT
jgi:hypothetical protein